MNHPPKVVVKDNYRDYLDGKEVNATILSPTKDVLWVGEHVIAFKDTIAAGNNISVPRNQQSHYIGIEGMITDVPGKENEKSQRIIRIKKL